MLAMHYQNCIKDMFENKDLSINKISQILGINWRTAQKYAYKEDWNVVCRPKIQRESRVMTDEFKTIIDVILKEDTLVQKKQRHTSKRIYNRLVEEFGFTGAYRTVCTYVFKAREELKSKENLPTESFERLEHPGSEAQIDFCTQQVYKDDVLQDVKMLVMSFPYSNRPFLQPLPAENQECFLEGLKMLFKKCGKVPTTLWFDNLSAAVVNHKPSKDHTERTLTESFIRFKNHYNFKAVFCGPRKGNEKGNVENKCGYSRRNLCVPIPIVKDFETFSDELDARVNEDVKRNHYLKGKTIQELFKEEYQLMRPLPDTEYEVFKLSGAILNKYGEVTIDGNKYKVFRGSLGQKVVLKIYWNEILVLNESHELLEKLPRSYMFKPQKVNWNEVFRTYVTKPKTYKYSQFQRMLPESIQQYIAYDEAQTKERITNIYHWLNNYTIEQISKVLNECTGKETAYVITKKMSTYYPSETAIIEEDPYTPELYQNHRLDLTIYDELAALGGKKK